MFSSLVVQIMLTIIPPEEITNGLITSGLSAQAQCQSAKVVIIPLLPRDTKNSLRRGNINVINTLLLFKCSKHNLHTFKHQLEWLNIDRSLNMSLFYKDRLHLIKNGNELLAKEILCSYKSLKIKLHNSSFRSFRRGNIIFIKRFGIPSASFRTPNIKPSNAKEIV